MGRVATIRFESSTLHGFFFPEGGEGIFGQGGTIKLKRSRSI
jgi:hypothetical protein